jgi:hypothetical protein
VIHVASGELERIANSDFGGAEPCHGQVLNLKGFEFDAPDHDAPDRQLSDGQWADRECADCDRGRVSDAGAACVLWDHR